jgi:hypothetical protein
MVTTSEPVRTETEARGAVGACQEGGRGETEEWPGVGGWCEGEADKVIYRRAQHGKEHMNKNMVVTAWLESALRPKIGHQKTTTANTLRYFRVTLEGYKARRSQIQTTSTRLHQRAKRTASTQPHRCKVVPAVEEDVCFVQMLVVVVSEQLEPPIGRFSRFNVSRSPPCKRSSRVRHASPRFRPFL